jgi:2-hydroxychromene-2-carboxylate isomerase
MSLRTVILPTLSAWLLSRTRLLRLRAKAERARVATGKRHEVHYFHQPDDPYSALAAQILPRLFARYDIELVPHVVGPPSDSAAPDRARLIAYARRDAHRLARHWGLDFPDVQAQPAPLDVDRATRLLVASAENGTFVSAAGPLSACLWQRPADLADYRLGGAPLPSADAEATASHVAAANALRERLGHYLGAMFHYAGEWYWGIDRLHHLERRLQDLRAQRDGAHDLLFPPSVDVDRPVQILDPPPIDFFFSFRSPYSAIAAPRLFELSRLTGVPVRLRYILPMVMRGLPVPREKRFYIAADVAREAFVRGTPFGRFNDPVGRPTERGLAVLHLAEKLGRGEAFVLSFMRGVWAEGIDAGSNRGLRTLAERAGIPWADVRTALGDASWRPVAERNRQELLALGLWGAPTFHVRDLTVWGQDRLWAVQEELLKPHS